ncbi:MAG: hypothetical protein WCD79_15390 [Chthoniobacteraceae bacterium]
MNQRVSSLSEVARRADSEKAFSYLLRDFLDGFYEAPGAAAFAEEPAMLAPVFGDDGRADAYLAAVGEHLSRQYRLPVPKWALAPGRCLAAPWFAMKSAAGRILLLADSPAAFRTRNLFVSHDALMRV